VTGVTNLRDAADVDRANGQSYLVCIVLTFNEEIHIQRCLRSAREVTPNIMVVDSGSTDETVSIALAEGARVCHRAWTNHAEQFNWALSQIGVEAQWVLRLDADEVLSEQLVAELKGRLQTLPDSICGISIPRAVVFQGSRVRWGGMRSVPVVRLFRPSAGRSENRLMDEHIRVEGGLLKFRGHIIDDNLRTISWWIEKHNSYASREAVEILNLEFNFLRRDEPPLASGTLSVRTKRWIKNRFYWRAPGGVRAILYFAYRYIFRLGILDRGSANAFHVLQAFWYRFLVDLKVSEVKRYARDRKLSVEVAIEQVLGMRLPNQ
jgi:glycosyltransferase involved in cell wall biosynthesis